MAPATSTTWQKSAIEQKMFWKVTLPSTLIFPAQQDDCTINLALSFYLYLNLKPLEKCFFSDVGLRDMIVTKYSEMKRILFFVSLAAWLLLARDANSWWRKANSNPGNGVCVFFFFFFFPFLLF